MPSEQVQLHMPSRLLVHASDLAPQWTPHIDIGNPVNRILHAPNVANANE